LWWWGGGGGGWGGGGGGSALQGNLLMGHGFRQGFHIS